jgi:hypothetical protein
MASELRTLKLQLLADTEDFIKGLKKAENNTQDFSSKIDSYLKVGATAFLGVASAVGTAAIAIGIDAVKAAAADEDATKKLNLAIKNVTGSTDKQIKKVNDYIDATELATGVTDDQLRPSLERLIRSTKDTTKAIELQKLAMDISAGTGKDLGIVTEGLSKLVDGNFAALKKLGIPLDENIVKTKDYDAAVKQLGDTFDGQAKLKAESFEGQMLRVQAAISQTKEELGKELLPALTNVFNFVNETIIPIINNFVDGLTGDTPKSMSEAIRLASGRVSDMAEDVDTEGNTGYSLGASLRRLIGTVSDVDSTLLIATDPESGIIRAIAAIESFINSIDRAIKMYKAFQNTLIGGAVIDVSKLVNPGVITQRLLSGQSLFQGTNTANNLRSGMANPSSIVNITVNGVTDTIQAGRVLAQLLRNNANLGINP